MPACPGSRILLPWKQHSRNSWKRSRFCNSITSTKTMPGSWAAGITIDISTKDKVLFHYSCRGTNPDNDQWVLRKKNAVNRFGHSSLYLGVKLRELALTLEQKYMVSEREYSAHGGCFPLAVRGVGIIGTITVSGLAQEDDHALVVEVVREFLTGSIAKA